MKRILYTLLLLALCTGCAAPVERPPQTAPTAGTTSPSIPTEASMAPTEASTAPTEPTEPSAPAAPALLDLLTTAIRPVGSTMYVWGGGWNEEDTGAGIEATTIGLPKRWANFTRQQFPDYDHENTRYQIHDGLDCSGYLGWAIYNTLETEDGRPGYVYKASQMAQTLSQRGLGDYLPAKELDRWLPGDLMSMEGHCWLVVGQCDDGSVLLLHASPPGVIFSGTKLPDGSPSEASRLAEATMAEQFPQWHASFPDYARSHSYLTKSSALRWNDATLPDPDGLRSMTAQEVLALLFPA